MKNIFERPWDVFFKEKITRIFTEKQRIVDIGGGLRVDGTRNNRFDKERASWVTPLLKDRKYLILDKVADYHPDIVGDIHALPFADASEEAIICMAVLEHVENPFKAAEEMHRVLKPGGFAFVYVPFLYYYHADPGYYDDYWRYSKDALEVLFKGFSVREYAPVRGAFETWIKLSPLGRWSVFLDMAHIVDRISGKIKSKQTSGYNIFLVK